MGTRYKRTQKSQVQHHKPLCMWKLLGMLGSYVGSQAGKASEMLSWHLEFGLIWWARKNPEKRGDSSETLGDIFLEPSKRRSRMSSGSGCEGFIRTHLALPTGDRRAAGLEAGCWVGTILLSGRKGSEGSGEGLGRGPTCVRAAAAGQLLVSMRMPPGSSRQTRWVCLLGGRCVRREGWATKV